VQPIWTYGFNLYEVLKYATQVKAIFAVQFQVINRKTWDSLGADIQPAFAAAAQEAADQANAMDEASECRSAFKDWACIRFNSVNS
jgi:TRAP-type C4-dicarboxylate transport system substrate-binding protein